MFRFLIMIAFVGCAGSSEQRSTLDSIPKAAAQAVRAQSHGMTITKVDRETENGEEVFEAVWMENGVRHEAKVTAHGKLLQLEVEVAAAAVPAAVRETAERQLGKGVTYERLLSGNFEAEVAVKGGPEREIEIQPDGTVVTPAPKLEQHDDNEETDDE